MNFTEFSFWWTICVVGVPALLLRAGARRLGFWGPRWDRALLLFVSLSLFFNASPPSLLIFLFEIGLTFATLRAMDRLRGGVRLALVMSVITLEVLLLAYFKYTQFIFGDFLTALSFGHLHVDYATVMPGVPAIPPGISFYTFQMMGILIDSYRDPEAGRLTFLDCANFASFFPQIVAGPIERRAGLLPQVQSFTLRFDPKDVEAGVRWLVLGLFLKLVLSNNISPFIRMEEAANPFGILLSVYLFGLRIYFDFAGYSLIALGLGRVLGIRLTLNFLAPYVSRSPREFWHRWHVTLSNWFRDYLYIPLGGSRVRFWAFNVMLVFTASGLWHGAGWNFVIWGAYHGALLVAHRVFSRSPGATPAPAASMPRGRIGPIVRWLGTYTLAMFGWIFFMETDWTRLLAKLHALTSLDRYTLAGARDVVAGFGRVDQGVLATALVLAHVVLIVELLGRRRGENERNPYRMLLATPVTTALILALFLLMAREPSQFIYFAF